MKNGFYLWSPDIDSVVSRPALDKLSLAVSRLLNSETESLRNELATANALAKESFEHWAQSVLVNIDDLKEENRAHELAGKDYYEHMMKDENAIADYQEQAAELIKSNVAYADALELVNEQLVELQAENELLLRQLGSERTTADSFNSEFRNNPNDDVISIVIENATKCDGCKKTISLDDIIFSQSSDGTALYECPACYNNNEYEDIVEHPVIHSDNYNNECVKTVGKPKVILCDLCDSKDDSDLKLVYSLHTDYVIVCKACLDDDDMLIVQ